MIFDPEALLLGIDPPESVRGVSVHVPVAIRSAVIGVQDSSLVSAFGYEREEVPDHVWVGQVGLGVTFLGMNEVRELDWVSNEKDRSVVPHEIPVAVFSVKFNSEATWIPLGVS